MNEELQEELVKRFTKRFQKYNERVLYKLGQTIKEIGNVIPSDAYKLGQQLKYNTTIKDLENELAKIIGKSIEDIQPILEHIAKENITFSEPFYEAKGLNTPIYEEHKELQKLVQSMATLSNNEFVNIARTTGFKLLDINKEPLLLNVEETYHRVIDEAVYAVTTGKESYNQLMRKTIKQLANSGVRNIEYESGYSRRIDTAVRMNLMDTIRQVSNEASKILGEEFEADGVEITVHEYPAPDHARVQGRQFSHEEFTKFQNHEICKDYQGNTYNKYEGGKERRSISEYNCYHHINQVVLGVDNPLYSNERLKEIIENNNKSIEINDNNYTLYEATQLQRRIETEIRKAKEQQIIAESAEDEELAFKSQERVRHLKHKYTDISKQINIEKDVARTYVPNYKEKNIKNKLLYQDVTQEWLDKAMPNSHELKLDNYFIDDNSIRHPIKGKEVVHAVPTSGDEYDRAIWLRETFGGNIHIVPRITDISNQNLKVSTPDYRWNGKKWDLKTPTQNGDFKTAIERFMKQSKTKRQSQKFIIDFKHYKDKSDKEIIELAEKTLNNPYRNWIEDLMLVKGDKVIKIYSKSK